MSTRSRSTAFALAWAPVLIAPTATASAQEWRDATAATIGGTAEWSNKVELADVDGDGHVDILFANGGDYSSAGTPEPTRVFRNLGRGQFEEATDALFAQPDNLARVVKVRDIDGDGRPDVLIGNTFQTRSRLFLGDRRGALTEVTATHLPGIDLSVGDLELGDVDGDGDLDVMLADWGAGDPLESDGGRVRLWRNDGTARFEDVTEAAMPDRLIGFSWELELVDVDNDLDLDAVVSCKVCTGSALYRNDGTGLFSDASEEMPQFGNNYEFEAIDLDGDGWQDLVTINDGPGGNEHVFRGTGTGFVDATAELWPDDQNQAVDDNMVAFLDVDSDGDADFLIGSLGGDDRLMRNDGTGHLTMEVDIRDGSATGGTLGIAIADLNGDRRLDWVDAQGEADFPDRVYFGVDIPVDSAAPSVALVESVASVSAGASLVVRARVHDRKTPVMTHDFASVRLLVTPESGRETEAAMAWYGEALWRGQVDVADQAGMVVRYRVCAEDVAGNEACSEEQTATVGEARDPDAGPGADGGGPGAEDAGGTAAGDSDEGGCGCQNGQGGSPSVGWLVIALVIAVISSRRRF